MTIAVEPCSSIEELMDALRPINHYFGGRTHESDTERWARTLPHERMHAAREDGAIVGGAGVFPFELTVPGGMVRAAGVTVVGVLPTHRRRGILRAMMRAQLRDVHQRGETVAYLWASEETIYGRFGYGMASLCGEIDVPKASNAYADAVEPRPGARLRMVEETEALEPFSEIYDRARPLYPGMFARSKDWWALRRLNDHEHRRQGGGLLNRVLLTHEGRPDGYALYRMHQAMEGGASTGFVNVIEAIGATPEATREIWRFLLDIDWIARVKASLLPVDHPLLFLLARNRAMKLRMSDALWVRLVDVPAALSSRTFGRGEPVVLDVADAFCPWNEGRYRIAAEGGAGVVERTSIPPDLALDAAALGSVYLGGFSFAQLAEAGRVRELREGAVARADALFNRGRAPWCVEIF
jgi:predicted acetyltransferase